jgi:trimeric autotransporter adhesin
MKRKLAFWSLFFAMIFCLTNAPSAEEQGDITINSRSEKRQAIEPMGTEAHYNTFYGTGAGHKILSDPSSTGESNTFIGSQAGYGNADGWANTFVGRNAGYSDKATGNTFIGYYSGFQNTTGEYNTFIGHKAGQNNKVGSNSTFIGNNAGIENTAKENTFIGAFAGSSNTTGEYNTFIGRSAGQSNKTGSNNLFIGETAGFDSNHSSYNLYIGTSAGCKDGGENTIIGHYAGALNGFGEGNVFLGYSAGRKSSGSSKLYIDNSDTETPLIWGDFEANNVVIYGGFRAIASYSSSDRRWKKNIESLESSLDKVSNLQGVSYEWKTDEYPDFGLMEGKQIGLVAQDVEQVLPELVSEGKDGYKAVSYTKLTAVLVEAVKELKSENQSQKKLIEEQRNQFTKQLGKQQAEIEELRSMIKELKS